MSDHLDARHGSAAELRAAFDLFDVDGDGALNAAELQRALAVVGQPLTRPAVQQLIATVDDSGTGELAFDGFVRLVEPQPRGLDAEADLREAFRALDRNGDGYLDAQELARVAARADDRDSHDVARILAQGDIDGDGRLSFAEFRRMMKAS